MGSKKGTSSQKSVVPGIIRTRADAPIKTPRQRRRTGGASTKSMCAASISCAKAIKSTMETAEPIKRTTELEAFDGTKISTEKNREKCYLDELPHELSSKDSGLHSPCHAVGKGFLKTSTIESVQTSETSMKLKLQLFPIDEVTRKGLEEDGHNPHLELTLGARKKISSVLKHLNTKWGKSGIALGELVLFPYSIKQENLASYRRWTAEDIDTSASDVHAAIGCPPIFRLRYGWFSTLEQITSQVPQFTSLSYEDCVKPKDVQEGCTNIKDMDVEKQSCQEDMPITISTSSNAGSANPILLDQVVDVGNLRTGSDATFSSALWTDTPTNISMGDLLKETSQIVEASDPLHVDKNSCLPQIPFSSDSFDAAIAALIYRHQGTGPSTPAFHSTIWNAEETCHPFPFQKNSTSREEVGGHSQDTTFGPFSQISRLNSASHPDKDCAYEEPTPDLLHQEQGLDNTESNFRMTDITWPDSLGPLDLALTSSREIISGDSISLSGLIASSLDAFQNCSLLGKD